MAWARDEWRNLSVDSEGCPMIFGWALLITDLMSLVGSTPIPLHTCVDPKEYLVSFN